MEKKKLNLDNTVKELNVNKIHRESICFKKNLQSRDRLLVWKYMYIYI